MQILVGFFKVAFPIVFVFSRIADCATVCADVPGGTVVQYLPGKCIYVRQAPIYKRDSAKRECLQLGSQPNVWRLPKLDSKEKSDEIRLAVQKITHTYEYVVWLDLIRDDPTEAEMKNASLWGDPSKWRWFDNTTLESNAFESWGPNSPNNLQISGNVVQMERCAMSYGSNGHWNDAPCDVSSWHWYSRMLFFVCEANATIIDSNSNNAILASSAAVTSRSIPPAPTAAAVTSDKVKVEECCQQSESLLGAVVFGDICLVVLVCAVLLAGYYYWKQIRQNNADKSSFALSSVACSESNGRHNPKYQRMDENNDSEIFSTS